MISLSKASSPGLAAFFFSRFFARALLGTGLWLVTLARTPGSTGFGLAPFARAPRGTGLGFLTFTCAFAMSGTRHGLCGDCGGCKSGLPRAPRSTGSSPCFCLWYCNSQCGSKCSHSVIPEAGYLHLVFRTESLHR